MDESHPEDRARRPYDGAAPPPRVANIETTRFCNLRCRMCSQFRAGTTATGPHMGLEVFADIADEVFPAVEVWQPSVSGEPTMAKGFDEMLALTARHGVGLDITTNATLLSPRVIDRLVPVLRSIMISFDSPDRATFERIREGADFDRVVANVVRLRRRCRDLLPPDDQPLLALSVTLMRRNIEQLPALVEMAHRPLGVGLVYAQHVFPDTDEMRAQSLAHEPELARRCIEDAARLAETLGMTLRIMPLDRVTSDTAMGTSRRAIAAESAPAPVLGMTTVNEERLPPPRRFRRPPLADLATAEPSEGQGEAIWYCGFLWNRTYVHLDGAVQPCCVPGAPVVGRLWDEGFADLWNNATYRAMRQRLVARDPAPVCRGCMHLREIRDPAGIDAILGGAAIPRRGDLIPLPAALDPTAPPDEPRRREPAPRLAWAPRERAERYAVELSLDRFYTVEHRAEVGSATEYRVPPALWLQAPAERTIFWRALGHIGGARQVVARGRVPPERRSRAAGGVLVAAPRPSPPPPRRPETGRDGP